MFKNGVLYLLAKLVPLLSSLVVLALLTRWLDTAAYGVYSTVQTIAYSASLVLFSWLYVGVMRFWESGEVDSTHIQALLFGTVAMISGGVALIGVVWAYFSQDWFLVGATVLVFFSAAWYEAHQRLHAISEQANVYLYLEVTRTLFAALLGIIGVGLGFSWMGAVAGLVAAIWLSLLGFKRIQGVWQPMKNYNHDLLKSLLRYGVPLSLSLILLESMHLADRLLLTHFIGFDAAGQYAVAYNLPYQILMVLASALNLAAYPRMMRLYERQGVHAAADYLAEYGTLLLAVIIPAMVGLIAIAPVAAPLLVGADFVPTVLDVLPLLSLGLLANCVYLFYVSLVFQLHKTINQSLGWIALVAGLNMVLNAVWIPLWGVRGAALATTVAYVLCLVGGFILAARQFPLRFVYASLIQISVAAGVMYFAVSGLPSDVSVGWLLAKVSVGVLVYGVCAWGLDIVAIRSKWLPTFYNQFILKYG